MAHFVIKLGDPGKDSFPWANMATITMNGMDISSSVTNCEVLLNMSEPALVRLEVFVKSLEVEGQFHPAIEATLLQSVGEDQEPEQQEFPLKEGGTLRLIKGLK